MLEQQLNNLKELFLSIKGKKVYYLKEIPIKETVREPGGYDHLGCLPDLVYTQIIGYKTKIDFFYINEHNIEELIENLVNNNIFLTEEDAQWTKLIQDKEKEGKL